SNRFTNGKILKLASLAQQRLDPARRCSSARPSFTGLRIAILGCNLHALEARTSAARDRPVPSDLTNAGERFLDLAPLVHRTAFEQFVDVVTNIEQFGRGQSFEFEIRHGTLAPQRPTHSSRATPDQGCRRTYCDCSPQG